MHKTGRDDSPPIANLEIDVYILTNLLVSSANKVCKQIGPRSGPTKRRS